MVIEAGAVSVSRGRAQSAIGEGVALDRAMSSLTSWGVRCAQVVRGSVPGALPSGRRSYDPTPRGLALADHLLRMNGVTPADAAELLGHRVVIHLAPLRRGRRRTRRPGVRRTVRQRIGRRRSGTRGPTRLRLPGSPSTCREKFSRLCLTLRQVRKEAQALFLTEHLGLIPFSPAHADSDPWKCGRASGI